MFATSVIMEIVDLMNQEPVFKHGYANDSFEIRRKYAMASVWATKYHKVYQELFYNEIGQFIGLEERWEETFSNLDDELWFQPQDSLIFNEIDSSYLKKG